MKYTVLKAVQLPAGTLVKFNEAQAARRGNQVALVKGKQYECLVPVWVKAGEIIDLDEPAKHVLASLQAQSGKPAAPEKVFVSPAAAKTQAEAEAQADAEAQAELDAEAAAADAETQRAADEAAALLLTGAVE